MQQVSDYFTTQPAARLPLLLALHDLITGLYPRIQVDMKYRMPTYQLDDGWVALANQKHYVSLYTCGYHHIEGFKLKRPQIKTGKGCINFKPAAELPLADIAEVVRHALEHPKPA